MTTDRIAVTATFLDKFSRLGAKPDHDFGDPVAKKLGLLVRPAFIADPGRTLVWGDESAIEARVLPGWRTARQPTSGSRCSVRTTPTRTGRTSTPPRPPC